MSQHQNKKTGLVSRCPGTRWLCGSGSGEGPAWRRKREGCLSLDGTSLSEAGRRSGPRQSQQDLHGDGEEPEPEKTAKEPPLEGEEARSELASWQPREQEEEGWTPELRLQWSRGRGREVTLGSGDMDGEGGTLPQGSRGHRPLCPHTSRPPPPTLSPALFLPHFSPIVHLLHMPRATHFSCALSLPSAHVGFPGGGFWPQLNPQNPEQSLTVCALG